MSRYNQSSRQLVG